MGYLKFLLNKSKYLIGFQIKIQSDKILLKIIPSKIGKYRRVIQLADPFLFVKNDILYCFYEKYIHKGKGTIEVVFSPDMINWQHYNVNLNVNCHLSFPFIYQENADQIYMIPETAELNEVSIYKAEFFPSNWTKHKVLLIGNYVDSHIFKHKGIYYLFTTKKELENGELRYNYITELYYSIRLDGEYIEHPKSPICKGREYGRSGGSIFMQGDKFYRPVQDCLVTYGRELHLFEILKIDEQDYDERIYKKNLVLSNWNRKNGGHHLTHANLGNQQILAYDFNIKESYFQRFINILKY